MHNEVVRIWGVTYIVWYLEEDRYCPPGDGRPSTHSLLEGTRGSDYCHIEQYWLLGGSKKLCNWRYGTNQSLSGGTSRRI